MPIDPRPAPAFPPSPPPPVAPGAATHDAGRAFSVRVGFSAGVLAAGLMLGGVVLLRLASGVTSLPEVVAEGLLLLMPGALFSTLLDALQRSAKPLLYLGLGVGTLLVGGLLGRLYGAQPGRGRAVRIVLGTWLGFGLGVYTLLGAGPFGWGLRAGPLWHAGTLLGLFALFGATLVPAHRLLLRRGITSAEDGAGRPRSASADGADASRRVLLATAGAAVAASLVVGSGWRWLFGARGGPTGAGGGGASAPNPPPFDVVGLSTEVTPVDAFYTVSKNLVNPGVDAAGWRLRIDGLVDHPLDLSYEDLRALPATEGYYTLLCISNEVGGDLWGNAYWKGVRLRDLLLQAGVHTDAYKALFTAADDYRDSVRLARAMHPDTLLAWEMNGAPLTRDHGFPARLLIPGIYGMKNVKWLTRVSVVAEDVKGFWQSQGWDDDAPYQTTSRIDAPAGRSLLVAGPNDVAGVAFAGDRGISRVEVSGDGGRTWQPAEVKPGLSPDAWQLWRARLDLSRSTHDLRVRATDGAGHVQTGERNPPFPAGSTGLHTVTVAVE